MCCSLKINLHITEELRHEILVEMISINEKSLAAVVCDFQCWLQMVFYVDGAYIKMVLCDCQSLKTTELRHQIQCCLLCSTVIICY